MTIKTKEEKKNNFIIFKGRDSLWFSRVFLDFPPPSNSSPSAMIIKLAGNRKIRNINVSGGIVNDNKSDIKRVINPNFVVKLVLFFIFEL